MASFITLRNLWQKNEFASIHSKFSFIILWKCSVFRLRKEILAPEVQSELSQKSKIVVILSEQTTNVSSKLVVAQQGSLDRRSVIKIFFNLCFTIFLFNTLSKDKVSMSYLFFFSRYQAKCVISSYLDVISFQDLCSIIL